MVGEHGSRIFFAPIHFLVGPIRAKISKNCCWLRLPAYLSLDVYLQLCSETDISEIDSFDRRF